VVGIDNTAWLVEQMEQWDTDDPRFDLLMIDELSRYKGPTGKRSREMTLIADRFQQPLGPDRHAEALQRGAALDADPDHRS
jgi:hypothetical protein